MMLPDRLALTFRLTKDQHARLERSSRRMGLSKHAYLLAAMVRSFEEEELPAANRPTQYKPEPKPKPPLSSTNPGDESIDPSTDLRLLHTAKEIAEELRVLTAARIEELAIAGCMPHILIEGRRWYWRRQVFDYIREHLGTLIPGRPADKATTSGCRPEPTDVPDELRAEASSLRQADGDGYPSCVYFLIRNRAVVYVGQSCKLSTRLESHLREKTIDRILFLPVPEQDLRRVEAEYIRKLRPILNCQGRNTESEFRIQ